MLLFGCFGSLVACVCGLMLLVVIAVGWIVLQFYC